MFTRTDAGISSEYLFYDVDWVVYCEGSNDSADVASLDEAFWTKVLGDLGLKCKCKSMGSKSDLLEVAQKVVDDVTDKTIVALDRDYDHLTGDLIQHPRVFYTFGYSWESDACLEFSIRRVVQLFANILHCETIATEYRAYRDTLSRQLKKVFALDFKYSNHSGALFDRGKPLSIVEIGGASAPSVRRRTLLQNALQLEKHTPLPLPKDEYLASCGFRDFFGKTVSRLVYHWFVKRTSRLSGRRRVHYDGVMMSIIDSMALIAGAEARNDHYLQKVAALT